MGKLSIAALFASVMASIAGLQKTEDEKVQQKLRDDLAEKNQQLSDLLAEIGEDDVEAAKADIEILRTRLEQVAQNAAAQPAETVVAKDPAETSNPDPSKDLGNTEQPKDPNQQPQQPENPNPPNPTEQPENPENQENPDQQQNPS